MTSLLREAIAHLRTLADEDQDVVAELLFTYLSSDERYYSRRPVPKRQSHMGTVRVNRQSEPVSPSPLSIQHRADRH